VTGPRFSVHASGNERLPSVREHDDVTGLEVRAGCSITPRWSPVWSWRRLLARANREHEARAPLFLSLSLTACISPSLTAP